MRAQRMSATHQNQPRHHYVMLSLMAPPPVMAMYALMYAM